MSKTRVIYSDPFLQDDPDYQNPPHDAQFICSYEIYFGVDSFKEPAYIRRSDMGEELWVADYYDRYGLAFVIPPGGSIESASTALLDMIIRSRVGFYWPTRFHTTGILDEQGFNDIVKRIDAELDAATEQAKKNKPEIVSAAENLGLDTRPTGTSENHWRANCPCTNHSLELQASDNLFFCGYCNRSGGIEDLKQFVEERRNG